MSAELQAFFDQRKAEVEAAKSRPVPTEEELRKAFDLVQLQRLHQYQQMQAKLQSQAAASNATNSLLNNTIVGTTAGNNLLGGNSTSNVVAQRLRELLGR